MPRILLRLSSFVSIFFFSVEAIKIPDYYKGTPFYTVNFEQNELPLVVIVCTYNNSKWYDRNLQSIFDQKYTNYRVIIIDDCSNDGTGDLIAKYIKDKGQQHRCTLIRNSQRRFKMANLYNAVHSCSNNEIVIEFDGDDWFFDDRVFSYFNELYSSSDVWLTYGGYQEYPSGKPGFCRQIPTEVIDANNFRSYYRTTSQQRTFYAGLFKRIPLEDLIFEGKFFQTTSDVAQMMPMFEMAGNRIAYNYRKLYIYNLANTINDHKVDAKLQTRSNDYVLNRRKLNVIDDFSTTPDEKVKNSLADIIIFSESPNNLTKTLINLKHLINSSSINIICTHYQENKEQYDSISTEFKDLNFHNFFSSDLTPLIKIINELKNEYIFFMNDSSNINIPIDLNKYIRTLEKTSAFAWYCKNINASNNDYSEIENNVFAMQFGQKNSLSQNAITFNMALYRKKEILDVLKNINLSQDNLEKNLNQNMVKSNAIALFTPMN